MSKYIDTVWEQDSYGKRTLKWPRKRDGSTGMSTQLPDFVSDTVPAKRNQGSIEKCFIPGLA